MAADHRDISVSKVHRRIGLNAMQLVSGMEMTGTFNNLQAGAVAAAPCQRPRVPHLPLMEIFTIGYEGATQADVVAKLQDAGVKLLADIRAVPLSRRPGFSKNVLAAGLRGAGIDYVGLKSLGTPPEGREAARKGNHDRLAAVYAGQLELPEAIVQAEMLKEMAAERPTALLCFERDPATCHRSLLVEAIFPDVKRTDLFD